jgi:hypothetical protein
LSQPDTLRQTQGFDSARIDPDSPEAIIFAACPKETGAAKFDF